MRLADGTGIWFLHTWTSFRAKCAARARTSRFSPIVSESILYRLAVPGCWYCILVACPVPSSRLQPRSRASRYLKKGTIGPQCFVLYVKLIYFLEPPMTTFTSVAQSDRRKPATTFASASLGRSAGGQQAKDRPEPLSYGRNRDF